MLNEKPKSLHYEISRQIDFWQALNAAAVNVQQAAPSETAVYDAFAEQMVKMGIHGAVCMLDETDTFLTITTIVMSEKQSELLEPLLKLGNFSIVGYQFKVTAVPLFQKAIQTASPLYLADNTEIVRIVLSALPRRVIQGIVKVFGADPTIAVPIFGESKVIGLMFYTGPSLTDEDLPAISAFSNHLSIALENAALFQSLQRETDLIRKREEQFRILAENVPGVIYLCENNYTFDMIYLNDGVETLTGYPKEKFLTREISFRDLYHPDDSENIQPEDIAAKGQPGTYHHIYQLRHRSGAWRWVEEFGKAVVDETGRLLFLEGSITDITERRQAEILQSTLYRIATVANADLSLEQMYPAIQAIMGDLMEANNFFIALMDEDNGLLTIPYFVDEMDNFDGQPFDSSGSLTDYVIQTGQPQLLSRLDIKKLKSEGMLKPMGTMPEIWLGVPLRTKANVFGAIVVQCYQDASAYTEREKQLLFFVSGQISAAIERKRSEEKLKQMAREIESQALMFEAILSNTPDQFTVFNLDGRIIFSSPFTNPALSFALEDILGKTMEELGFLPKEIVEAGHEEFERVIQEGISISKEIQLFIHPDQPLRDIEYILSPIKDKKGVITAVVSVSRDITERNKTKAALHHAQKLESLGILAGGVAHDFNNLLVGIMAQTSLAQAKLPKDSPALAHLAKAETATEQAAILTRQLLNYSGQGQFAIQPLSLNDLIKENQHLYHVAISSEVNLQFNLLADLPMIEGDANQLHQMLMNLLLNSAEAIEPDSGSITVSTTQQQISTHDIADWNVVNESIIPGNYVCLSIEDDGDGMDEETLKRIFEPFFTTKFTGRGLGLAAVSGIIRGHNGGLKIKSTPKNGTTIELIFAEVNSDQTTAVAKEEPHPATGYILVIDDELPVREAVTDILELEGLVTLTAVDGQSGIDLYRERWSEISLVLLDLSLPDIRGEEVFTHLHEINNDVQVILSSGYSEGDASHLLETSNVSFLQKPYTINTLLGHVKERL